MRFTSFLLLVAVSLPVVGSNTYGQDYASPFQQSCSQSSSCECSQCQQNPLRSICDPPGCGSRNWVDIDYLYFRTNGYAVPSLVTSSPAGTPRSDVGRLDDPSTTNLLGNDVLGNDWRSGLRLSFGRWLDDCGNTAITGSIFALDNSESMQMFPSDANQIVSRPFFNTNPAVDGFDSELVNFPGVVDGKITVTSDSDIFSANIGIQKKLCCCGDACNGYRRTDWYIGYRVFGLDENLLIDERLSPVGGLIPAGTTIDVIDDFETRNRFHGVELGLTNTWQKNRWSFSALGKVALGNVNQQVRINGSTTVTVPGVAPVVQPFGILASSSNIGEFERDRFGVITTGQFEIGYQVNNRTRIKLGYTGIFLNDVARPGSALDLNVNSTQFDPNVPLSGPASPAFDWESEQLFLHGFNAGLEFTF